jgi:hypothetical protein
MPTDSELLAARLVRMKVLIEALETACSQNTENREIFAKLIREMDAARAALEPHRR